MSIFSIQQLSNMPVSAPKYLIRNYLEMDVNAAIIGKSGSYKSFWAGSVGFHVASGIPFAGHDIVTQGPVIFIIGEGKAGFIRRAAAWAIVHDVRLKDLPIFISDQPCQLTNHENMIEVAEAIRAIAESIGEPVLICLDTLNRNYGAGDENSTADMTKAIGSIDFLRSLYGSTVLTVHHSGHSASGRGRGSSALYASLDTEFLIERQDDLAVISCTKSKDAPPMEPQTFELSTVFLGIYDDLNEEITSAVLQTTDRSATPAPTHGKWQALGLEVLQKSLEKTGNQRVKTDEWRKCCLTAAMPRTRFYEVKKSLISSGSIDEVSGFVSFPESVRNVQSIYVPDKPYNLESESNTNIVTESEEDRTTIVQSEPELTIPLF